MAKEYQATEKARRAQTHNESLSRAERAAVPESTGTVDPVTAGESEEPEKSDESSPDENTQSLFRPGDRAWLYMERVKPGLTKKLAHRWPARFESRGRWTSMRLN
ncbi:hypothetical protein PF001_g27345 [Phytophthora fragariae]|nr:hypothetical protein PF001_g27345 [Phytophthora fragariae]